MTVAVVHLPHLALSCLPAIARAPTVVVVHEDIDPRKADEGFTLRSVHRIVDADVALLELGVRPMQRVIDAQRVAPALVVAVVPRSRLWRELIHLAELLLLHSPCVEPLPPSSIAVDLTGLLRPVDQLLQDIERTLTEAGQAGVVVVGSPGKRLSEVLSRHLAATRNPKTRMVITAAQAERALLKVGIESLGLDVDVAESLMALGVKTARDLNRLVPAGAAAHLFTQARSVMRLLSHVDDPLTPLRPPEHIIETVDVDDAISALEPLGFVLGPLCERVCRRAVAREAKIAGVVVTLSSRHLAPFALALEFPAPLHEPRGLWSALMMRLDVTGVPGPVERLVLRVSWLVDGRRRQQDAFRESDTTPQALSALLAELRAEHGDDVAGCLRVSRELLPEQMSALSVTLPSSSSPSAALGGPRGAGAAADGDKIKTSSSSKPLKPKESEGGRFLAGWPWPVRLLRSPAAVGAVVVERRPFCRLEGEDRGGVPFSREYWLVLLEGERRALTFSDPESQEELIQGWFD
ncbi:MAG: hypothetical protein Q8O67_30230 [Deltaproteobacteria bacterium]|nr:hypothetical protein [Deltaproteobacteria bacterium]